MTPEKINSMRHALDLLVESGCLSAYQAHADGSALVRMDDERLCDIILELLDLAAEDPSIMRLVRAALGPSSSPPPDNDSMDVFISFLAACANIESMHAAVSNSESNP